MSRWDELMHKQDWIVLLIPQRVCVCVIRLHPANSASGSVRA